MEKKQHHLDDLFRQNLTDLEISPTTAGRSGFLKRAGEEIGKAPRKNFRTPFILGVVLLIVSTGIFFLLRNNSTSPVSIIERKTPSNNTQPVAHRDKNNRVTRPTVAESKSPNQTPNTLIEKTEQHANNLPSKPAPVSNISAVKSITSNKVIGSNVSALDNQKTEIPVTPTTPVSTTLLVPGSEPPTLPQNHPLSEMISWMEPLGVEALISPYITKLDGNLHFVPVTINNIEIGTQIETQADVHETPGRKDSKTISEDKPQKQTAAIKKNRDYIPADNTLKFSAGIYYSPEWVFNTLDNNKFANNFGLEAIMHYGPFSLRSGLGLSITTGYHEVAVETKPYLGTYSELQYITYSWDAQHYYLIATIHTSTKDVYDTVLKSESYNLTKRYTYLQIPLILGYNVIEKNRWTLGLRAGPIMSLLMNSHVLSGSYDPGKDMVVLMNDITPDRIALNWQAMGAVNIGLRLSDRFTFELEPNLRYYFNSVYEKNGASSKPWSAGFRAAFMINF
ncbi:MAG: outer membrane beta-barrel protein [Bacteroidota bacterium]